MSEKTFSKTKTIFPEPDMIVDDPDTIISVSTTMFSVTKNIVSVASKIMCVAEKTVSLTDLIFDAAQTLGSDSWKIADERELIVFVKGQTARKKRRCLC